MDRSFAIGAFVWNAILVIAAVTIGSSNPQLMMTTCFLWNFCLWAIAAWESK